MHLERLILILETVKDAGEGMNVGQISDDTGLPKPSCYRLVQDLVETGLLEPQGKGLFKLGSRLRRITDDDHTDRDILAVTQPMLKDAANRYGATFFLSRLRGRGVEIIHVQIPEDDRVSYLHPGLGFRPLHACSCSKAIAAFADEPYLSAALQGKLKAYTEYTRTDASDLQVEFEQIRANGFAECVQEIEVGMCSVAAPVHRAQLGPALSLGATGSARVFTGSFRARIGSELIQMAARVAISLWDEVDEGKSDPGITLQGG